MIDPHAGKSIALGRACRYELGHDLVACFRFSTWMMRHESGFLSTICSGIEFQKVIGSRSYHSLDYKNFLLHLGKSDATVSQPSRT